MTLEKLLDDIIRYETNEYEKISKRNEWKEKDSIQTLYRKSKSFKNDVTKMYLSTFKRLEKFLNVSYTN